ncbi:hypothetical protein GCM10009722_18870 [Williamsia deligens]
MRAFRSVGGTPSPGEHHTSTESEHAMSNFPHDDESQIGETDEIRREEKVYEAGQSDEEQPTGEIGPDEHSAGGSDGTTDGT